MQRIQPGLTRRRILVPRSRLVEVSDTERRQPPLQHTLRFIAPFDMPVAGTARSRCNHNLAHTGNDQPQRSCQRRKHSIAHRLPIAQDRLRRPRLISNRDRRRARRQRIARPLERRVRHAQPVKQGPIDGLPRQRSGTLRNLRFKRLRCSQRRLLSTQPHPRLCSHRSLFRLMHRRLRTGLVRP